MPGRRVVVLKHHAVVPHLGVVEHLLEVEDRTAGDVLLMEDANPVRGGPSAQRSVEDVGERVTMDGA
jgi:hypothetical protein